MKTSVVSIISTPVSSVKLSVLCAVSLGSFTDMPELNRECQREDDSSLLSPHHELMVAFENFLRTHSSRPTSPAVLPARTVQGFSPAAAPQPPHRDIHLLMTYSHVHLLSPLDRPPVQPYLASGRLFYPFSSLSSFAS